MTNNGENDLEMEDTRTGTAEDALRGFHVVKVDDNVPRNAWVLYRDGPNPIGLTRGQWMQKYGVVPTNEQFARRSYAIHASLTGNENLKTNGGFGAYDYMPPQVFVQHIQLSDSSQKIVDSIGDKTKQRDKAFALRAAEFRKIAATIGVPDEIPKFEKKLEGKEQVYETMGGGAQSCTIKYDNQIRAGDNIPNFQVWKGTELLEVAWHTKGGNGKYDGVSLAEAKALVKAAHGDGVEIALKATANTKSHTNRTMGTAQLDTYSDGANKRWAAQIGAQRATNDHFSRLTAVATSKDPAVKSANIDVKWLVENQPNHPLAKGLRNGEFSHHLRVIGSGNGRTSVQFSMENFSEETKRLLDEAGIPHSIANGRPGDYEKIKMVGETLPAVSVPYSAHVDGPLREGDDITAFLPEKMMIAGRDKHGERTGYQRTLSEYIEKKLRLPDDAAEALGVAPDLYSKTAEKTKGRYENRTRGDQVTSRGADF